MKKNETKTSKSQELYDRKRAEDQVFNRMLFWLAGAVIVELIMLLVNRFYVHARVSELGGQMAWRTALMVLLFAGIVLFAAFLAWGLRVRREDVKRGTLQFILAAGCLCVGVGGFAMRQYSTVAAPLVLAAVPGLAVLAMVFYLYQREFFGCVLVGGLGLIGLWLFRMVEASNGYIAFLVIALVVAAAGAVLAWKLKQGDGVLKCKERELTVLQRDAAYPAYYITAILTAVLLLAPLALGAAVAYYSIWVLAAWLFILAVFFTSRMM